MDQTSDTETRAGANMRGLMRGVAPRPHGKLDLPAGYERSPGSQHLHGNWQAQRRRDSTHRSERARLAGIADDFNRHQTLAEKMSWNRVDSCLRWHGRKSSRRNLPGCKFYLRGHERAGTIIQAQSDWQVAI